MAPRRSIPRAVGAAPTLRPPSVRRSNAGSALTDAPNGAHLTPQRPPIHPARLATCPPFANARNTGLSDPSPNGFTALTRVQAPSSNDVSGYSALIWVDG